MLVIYFRTTMQTLDQADVQSAEQGIFYKLHSAQ